MLVTLNTDGSFSPHNKNAGFAFWISSDAGKFQRWGKLKKAECPCSSEAQAVINGLYFIRSHPALKDCTKVVVNTDCKGVIRMVEKPDGLSKPRQKHLRRLRAEIQKYLGRYKGGKKLEFEFRHVPAHGEITNARTYVNDWLDIHAKLGRKL